MESIYELIILYTTVIKIKVFYALYLSNIISYNPMHHMLS